MNKILFGITSLTLGGAERVLVDLANELSKKYEITIWTLYGNGELEKELNSKVIVKNYVKKSYDQMSKIQKIIMPLKILLFQKEIYKKSIKENYDVEIAFLEGPITRLLSTKNSKTRKIAWVHNDISKVFGNGKKAKLKKKVDEKTYSNYEKIIFVSKDNLKKFEKVYPNIDNKKQVIYNYINSDLILKKSKENVEKFEKGTINFVTVARLVEQKGIDRLIRVHSKLIQHGLKHNFYVIGDGPEKENLTKMIRKNNVEKTFKLCGKKKNPYPYIKQADYFCLFSYFEGYGMVLDEAKILNKRILITDTAAREAIENYEKARIVPNNEQGIYKELEKILKNKNTNREETIETHNANKEILEEIEKLLEE